MQLGHINHHSIDLVKGETLTSTLEKLTQSVHEDKAKCLLLAIVSKVALDALNGLELHGESLSVSSQTTLKEYINKEKAFKLHNEITPVFEDVIGRIFSLSDKYHELVHWEKARTPAALSSVATMTENCLGNCDTLERYLRAGKRSGVLSLDDLISLTEEQISASEEGAAKVPSGSYRITGSNPYISKTFNTFLTQIGVVRFAASKVFKAIQAELVQKPKSNSFSVSVN